MEDYDEYMKKHLKKVTHHSIGFSRSRSNYYNSPNSSLTTASNVSATTIGRSADGAPTSSAVPPGVVRNADNGPPNLEARIKVDGASDQSVSVSGVSTSPVIMSISEGSSSEAMDTAPSECMVELGSRSEVAECTNPANTSDGGGSQEMPSQSLSASSGSGIGGVGGHGEEAIDARASNPMSTSGRDSQEMASQSPSTLSTIGVGAGSLEQGGSCSQAAEPAEANLEENGGSLAHKAQSTSFFSQEVKISEPRPTIATVEHSFAAPPGGVSEPSSSSLSSNSQQPIMQGSQMRTTAENEPMAGVSNSNSRSSDGMELSTSTFSRSESNTSQWNGIRTRRQVRLASDEDSNPEGRSQQRGEEYRRPQPPLGSLPRQAGTERDEEVQVNIMDVDEGSQDSQSSQNMLSSLVYSLGLTEHETKQAISLWHNRTIIPQLDLADVSAELLKRRQLYWEEEQNYEEQCRKAELLAMPVS